MGVVEQVEEQLVRLVDDRGDTSVGSVYLVDDEHDGQLGRQGLAQHEPRLRQGPLGRIDEEHDAVDHRQPPLDLAAEVGVPGSVDDVDGHAAVDGRRTGVSDGGVLREDRDALLALEVARVHRALVDVLMLAECAGLPEHGIDKRGLAVVDMRDDRDVTQIAALEALLRHGSLSDKTR